MKRLFNILIVFVIVCAPLHAHAGLWDDIVAFVKAGAIGASATTSTADKDTTGDDSAAEPITDEDEEGSGEGEGAPTTIGDEGMCRVPRAEPEIVCEPGAGFLCVNTPEPGVADDATIIRGTIDRTNAVVTQMSVAVQHEYTKNTTIVDTSSPLMHDCWHATLDAVQPFCLDADGFYAARVPLEAAGPYTISVGISRLSGDPAEKRVRLSRVVAPVVADDAVSFDPALDSPDFTNASVVNVIVSLLGDCQFCDFIGASTGAVTVTVENAIVESDGSERRVACSTNIEQGGQGRFMVGVPVGSGDNSFTVSICSVALPQGCEVIGGMRGDGPVSSGGFTMISPEPQPAYDADEYPTIDWAFTIDGMDNDACVDVQFNRASPQSICAQNGTFRTTLQPSVGINVVTVKTAGGKIMPWAFGWGHMVSPFERAGGEAQGGGLVAENAFQLAIPKRTITEVLQPLIANVVASDNLKDLIAGLLSSTPPTRGEPVAVIPTAELRAEAVEAIESHIQGCGGGGSMMDGKRLEIVGKPVVGTAAIEDMRLEHNKLYFEIVADDVEVHIRLVTDLNLDGVPEGEPLPLMLKFMRVGLTFQVSVESDGAGGSIVLIGSPYTDCDYKSSNYCKGTPAPLIAANIVGDATMTRGFVKCDGDSQLCEAINRINAQTGLVSEAVLDAINGMISCTGSATVTHMLRGGTPEDTMRVGCFADDPQDARAPLMGCTSDMPSGLIGPWELSLGAILANGITIGTDGIVATGDLRVGNAAIFDSIEDELHHPSVGIVIDPHRSSAQIPIHNAQGDQLMRLALSSDALNSLFFLMTHQPRGVLDIDLSEVMFKQLGFDFVEQCDAFVVQAGSDAKPSSLCNIRPRVSALLGTALSTYKYFTPDHPLLMRLRGNRALTPQLRIVTEADIPIVPRTSDDEFGDYDEQIDGSLIDLQLGGIEMSFYALEIDESVPPDEYGNPTVLLDEDGRPVIHSMRPQGPDDEGQIISFELTMLLAAEISDVVTNPDDTRKLMMKIRPLADRTRLVLTPIPGSNATTVPPESLVSALREKLQYAISIFSAKENAIALPLPKRLGLAPKVPTGDSLMGMLGLKELVFGNDGLKLSWDANSSFVTIDLAGTLTQTIERNGRTYTETY